MFGRSPETGNDFKLLWPDQRTSFHLFSWNRYRRKDEGVNRRWPGRIPSTVRNPFQRDVLRPSSEEQSISVPSSSEQLHLVLTDNSCRFGLEFRGGPNDGSPVTLGGDNYVYHTSTSTPIRFIHKEMACWQSTFWGYAKSSETLYSLGSERPGKFSSTT